MGQFPFIALLATSRSCFDIEGSILKPPVINFAHIGLPTNSRPGLLHPGLLRVASIHWRDTLKSIVLSVFTTPSSARVCASLYHQCRPQVIDTQQLRICIFTMASWLRLNRGVSSSSLFAPKYFLWSNLCSITHTHSQVSTMTMIDMFEVSINRSKDDYDDA